MPLTRRGFLAAALVGLRWRPGGSPAGRPFNPRLTARPGAPFRPTSTGLTLIGEHLPRGARLYLPASVDPTEPSPLMVALHGGGGNAGRWDDLHHVCEERGIVLLAPEARERTWDRVHGDFGPDVAFIDAALRYTFERCAVDPSRIVLAGFSDGASYTLSLGPCNGDLFTHLAAWSPGFSNPADPVVGRPRVFISHGDDDGVLPLPLTRDGIVPMFEMDGYEVTWVEFAGDHRLTDDVVERTLDWFLG